MDKLDAPALRSRIESFAQAQAIGRWDLGAASSNDSSVQVDRGEAKQMKAAQRSSITVRVWNGDGLVGITSTSDLSDSGLQKALAGAQDASAFGNPDDCPAFSPLATAPLQVLEQPLHEPRGILELLTSLKDAERQLLDRHDLEQMRHFFRQRPETVDQFGGKPVDIGPAFQPGQATVQRHADIEVRDIGFRD